jgi:predicted RecA/RadA family phage recombinase
MATKFFQRGNTLTIPAPAAVQSGDVVIAGAIVGVALIDADLGADVDVDTVGVWELPKVSALAVSLGDVIHWDAAAGLANKTASGNTKLGVAVAPAANPSGTVRVRLSGF